MEAYPLIVWSLIKRCNITMCNGFRDAVSESIIFLLAERSMTQLQLGLKDLQK